MMDAESKIRKTTQIKTRTAAIFGLLAGFFYSLIAWGVDGYRLEQAHAILPWLPFAIGFVLCALVGALAGYLTYRINHIFLTFIIWIVTGLIFAWVGNHMQFTLVPLALSFLSPELAAQVSFPVTASISAAQFLIWPAVTGLCVLAGMLSVNQVESAVDSAGLLGPMLPILLWVVLFSFAGFAVRDNLTHEMTEPVIGANQQIQFWLDNEGKTLDKNVVRVMRLSSLESIKDLLHQPRRLVLVGYDDMVSDMHVRIDFGDTRVRCSVLGNMINFCERE